MSDENRKKTEVINLCTNKKNRSNRYEWLGKWLEDKNTMYIGRANPTGLRNVNTRIKGSEGPDCKNVHGKLHRRITGKKTWDLVSQEDVEKLKEKATSQKSTKSVLDFPSGSYTDKNGFIIVHMNTHSKIKGGSKWQNPFPVESKTSKSKYQFKLEDSLQLYQKWIETGKNPMDKTDSRFKTSESKINKLKKQFDQKAPIMYIEELRDKILGCWCKPCHGDVLIRLLNGLPQVDTKTPQVDTKTPQVDTKTPQVDTKTPRVDTKTPQVDTKTPQVDTKTPQVDENTDHKTQLIQFSEKKHYFPYINGFKMNIIQRKPNYFIVQGRTREYILPIYIFNDNIMIRKILNDTASHKTYEYIFEHAMNNYNDTYSSSKNDDIKKYLERNEFSYIEDSKWYIPHIKTFRKTFKYTLSNISVQIDGKDSKIVVFVKDIRYKRKAVDKTYLESLQKMSNEKLGKLNIRLNDSHKNRITLFISELSESESDFKHLLYHVLYDLSKNVNVDQMLDDLRRNKTKWERDCFKDTSERVKEQYEFIINPFEIVEGITQCRKCGNKRIYMFQKQTRSGDETATTSCICTNKECNAHWVYSG